MKPMKIKTAIHLITASIIHSVKSQYFRTPIITGSLLKGEINKKDPSAPALVPHNTVTMLSEVSYLVAGTSRYLPFELVLLEGDSYIDDTPIGKNITMTIWLREPPAGSFDTENNNTMFYVNQALKFTKFKQGLNLETVPRRETTNSEYKPDFEKHPNYNDLIYRDSTLPDGNLTKSLALSNIGGTQYVLFVGKNIQTIKITIPADFDRNNVVALNYTAFWLDFDLESTYYTPPDQFDDKDYFVVSQVNSPFRAFRIDPVEPSIHSFQMAGKSTFTAAKHRTNLFYTGYYETNQQHFQVFDSSLNNSAAQDTQQIGDVNEFFTELKFQQNDSDIFFTLSFKKISTQTNPTIWTLDDFYEGAKYEHITEYDFFLTKWNATDYSIIKKTTKTVKSLGEVDFKHRIQIFPELNIGMIDLHLFSFGTNTDADIKYLYFNLETVDFPGTFNTLSTSSLPNIRATIPYVKELNKFYFPSLSRTPNSGTYTDAFTNYKYDLKAIPEVVASGGVIHSTCATTISYLNLIWGCFSCRDGYELISDERCICPVDSFDNGTQCEKCHETCTTCFGPTENDCLLCSGNLIQLTNGSCVVDQQTEVIKSYDNLSEEERKKFLTLLEYTDGPFSNFSKIPVFSQDDPNYPKEDTLPNPVSEDINDRISFYPELVKIVDTEPLNLVIQKDLEKYIQKETLEKLNFTDNFQIFFAKNRVVVEKVDSPNNSTTAGNTTNNTLNSSDPEVGNVEINIREYYRLHRQYYNVTYKNKMFRITFRKDTFFNESSTQFVVLTGMELLSRKLQKEGLVTEEPVEEPLPSSSTTEDTVAQDSENITYEYDLLSPRLYLLQYSYLITHYQSIGTRLEVDKENLGSSGLSPAIETVKLVVYSLFSAGGLFMTTYNVHTPMVSLIGFFQLVDAYKSFGDINIYYGSGPFRFALQSARFLEFPSLPFLKKAGVIVGSSGLTEREAVLRKIKNYEKMNLTIREGIIDDNQDNLDQAKDNTNNNQATRRRVLIEEDKEIDYFLYNERTGKLGLGNKNSFILAGEGTLFFGILIVYLANKFILIFVKKCGCLNKTIIFIQWILYTLIEIRMMSLFFLSIVDLTIHRFDLKKYPTRINMSYIAAMITLIIILAVIFNNGKVLSKMRYHLKVIKYIGISKKKEKELEEESNENQAKKEMAKESVTVENLKLEEYPEQYELMKNEDNAGEIEPSDQEIVRILEVLPEKQAYKKLSFENKLKFNIISSKMNLYYAKEGFTYLTFHKIKLLIFQVIVVTTQTLPALQVSFIFVFSILSFSFAYTFFYTKKIVKRDDYFLKRGARLKIAIQEGCLLVISIVLIIFSFIENTRFKISPLSQIIEVFGSVSLLVIFITEISWMLADVRLGYEEWKEVKEEMQLKNAENVYGRVGNDNPDDREIEMNGLVSSRPIEIIGGVNNGVNGVESNGYNGVAEVDLLQDV